MTANAGFPQAHTGGYEPDVYDQLVQDTQNIIARYPQARSALLPMLHLVQSIDGFVSRRGIQFCAEQLGMTAAEVSAVATFYTQYKRKPNGDYTVGVCTNTLCAMMGGDAIYEELSEHLGIGHDETTEDGKVTLERVECNAACDFAPVVMVNWEFFDNQTPDTARTLVDELRLGNDVTPTRGPSKVCDFKHVSRVLAGFPDGLADEGPSAGEASVQGTQWAKNHQAPHSQHPDTAADTQGTPRDGEPHTGDEGSSAERPTGAGTPTTDDGKDLT